MNCINMFLFYMLFVLSKILFFLWIGGGGGDSLDIIENIVFFGYKYVIL